MVALTPGGAGELPGEAQAAENTSHRECGGLGERGTSGRIGHDTQAFPSRPTVAAFAHRVGVFAGARRPVVAERLRWRCASVRNPQHRWWGLQRSPRGPTCTGG